MSDFRPGNRSWLSGIGTALLLGVGAIVSGIVLRSCYMPKPTPFTFRVTPFTLSESEIRDFRMPEPTAPLKRPAPPTSQDGRRERGPKER